MTVATSITTAITTESASSPVYSVLAVVDDAVEPLSQSLSVARLFTLPVNDSTESQLEDRDRQQWQK